MKDEISILKNQVSLHKRTNSQVGNMSSRYSDEDESEEGMLRDNEMGRREYGSMLLDRTEIPRLSLADELTGENDTLDDEIGENSSRTLEDVILSGEQYVFDGMDERLNSEPNMVESALDDKIIEVESMKSRHKQELVHF